MNHSKAFFSDPVTKNGIVSEKAPLFKGFDLGICYIIFSTLLCNTLVV